MVYIYTVTVPLPSTRTTCLASSLQSLTPTPTSRSPPLHLTPFPSCPSPSLPPHRLSLLIFSSHLPLTLLPTSNTLISSSSSHLLHHFSSTPTLLTSPSYSHLLSHPSPDISTVSTNLSPHTLPFSSIHCPSHRLHPYFTSLLLPLLPCPSFSVHTTHVHTINCFRSIHSYIQTYISHHKHTDRGKLFYHLSKLHSLQKMRTGR